MHGQAAWQIEVLSSGGDPATLVIVLGGRWRMDQHLPAADTLNDRLAAPVRRIRFDAGELAEWDSGLLSFVSGISKTCTGHGIAVDHSGLPSGAQRLLAETLEQQPDAIWRGKRQKPYSDSAKQKEKT